MTVRCRRFGRVARVVLVTGLLAACSSTPPPTASELLQQVTTTAGVRPGIVIGDSDIGRTVSVKKGTVIAITLSKATSAPRWGMPAYGEPQVLVTVAYRNPNHGPFAALMRAVGDGTTEVVVATECDRLGAMCAGWTGYVSVSG